MKSGEEHDPTSIMPQKRTYLGQAKNVLVGLPPVFDDLLQKLFCVFAVHIVHASRQEGFTLDFQDFRSDPGASFLWVSTWIISMYSSFLLHAKGLHIRPTGS